MLAMRVILWCEFVEVANTFKHDREHFLRQRCDALRHDDLAASERTAESVVEEGDFIHRPPPGRLRFCTVTCSVRRNAGSHRHKLPTTHPSTHARNERSGKSFGTA